MDWSRGVTRALGAALVVTAGLAHAQSGAPVVPAPTASTPGEPPPPPSPPSPPPPVATIPVEALPTEAQYTPPSTDPPPPGAYPRAFPARPLLLPSGGLEGTVNFRALVNRYTNSDGSEGTTSLGTADVSAQYGLGVAELQLGTSIYLFSDDKIDDANNLATEFERIQALYAQGRFAVAHETALGIALALAQPRSATSTALAVSGFAQHKLHFTDASALELSGTFGYDRHLDDLDLDLDGTLDSTSELFVVARAHLQMQIASRVAIAAHAQYQYVNFLDNTTSTPGSSISQRYGVGPIISLTPDLDLDIGAEVLSTSEPHTFAFIVGLTGRRIP